MSIPVEDVEVPEVVRRVAGGDSITPVWRNGRGGLAFRVGESRSAVDPRWIAEPDAEVRAIGSSCATGTRARRTP